MDLRDLYAAYSARPLQMAAAFETFSAPLLIKVPAGWADAEHRIAFVGQETFGWGWQRHRAQTCGAEWSYADQNALPDFFAKPDSIDALIEAYGQFDFAKHDPISCRSPFWRYFRGLREAAMLNGKTASIIWTNVIRCDAGDQFEHKLWNAPSTDGRAYLNWQNGLLRAELEILKPTMILFVCGPNYDQYLREEFGELRFEPLEEFEERAAAKIVRSALGAPAYRTYHPAYLNRRMRCGLGFAPLQAALDDTSTGATTRAATREAPFSK